MIHKYIAFRTPERRAPDTQPRIFTFAQNVLPTVEAGTPLIATILAYFDSRWLHTFNSDLRGTREDVAEVLGKTRPTSLAELADLLEELIRYG